MLTSLGQCNHGTDFYLAIGTSRQCWYGHLQVTTVSPNSVTYHIENSTGIIISSGNVTNGSPATVDIVSAYQHKLECYFGWHDSVLSKLQDNGLRVYTEGGGLISILVYVIDEGVGVSLLVFILQPYQDLALTQYTYYAVSTSGAYDDIASYFLIIGNEDNTTVTISPTETITIPQDIQDSNSADITVPVGGTHTITINRLQTLSVGIIDFGDITGTSIVSDKPLTVISGNECSQVPNSYDETDCDHNALQIPPTATWGQTFLLTPYQLRPSQYYKIVAAHSNTTVTYICTDSNDTTIFILEHAGDFETVAVQNQEDWLSIENTIYCHVAANKPIFIVQLGPGPRFLSNSKIGDVVMPNIPPIEQYSKNITFYRPDDSDDEFYYYIKYRYINIATTVQDTIVIMNDDILPLNWTTVYDGNNSPVGYGATVKLNDSYNSLYKYTITSSSPVSVLVYGWNNERVGYSYSAGVELSKSTRGTCM